MSLYYPHKFAQVKDAYIWALLRINDKMPIRDIRRTVTVSPQMNDQYAIHRLVYWITPSEIALVENVASLNSVAQPHIACVAEPMGVGRLYLVINTEVFVEATQPFTPVIYA